VVALEYFIYIYLYIRLYTFHISNPVCKKLFFEAFSSKYLVSTLARDFVLFFHQKYPSWSPVPAPDYLRIEIHIGQDNKLEGLSARYQNKQK
jgi:hypothetical protein